MSLEHTWDEATPDPDAGESTQSTQEKKARRRKPYTWFTRKRMETFLEELRRSGNVKAACESARVDRKTAYNERNTNPEFAAAWKESLEIAVEGMELEARRRAVDGTEEPVFGRVGKDQDGKIGTIRRYSDTLLIFLLKAHRPDVYRERYDIKHSGSIANQPVDLSKLSEEDLDQLEQILSKAADDPAAEPG